VSVLTTSRLRLRALIEGDAPFVVELVNEPAFLEHIGDKNVRSENDARRFIAEGPWTRGQPEGHGQLVVERIEDGEPVGVCGLLHRESLELTDVGFAILERHRGRGYATEAAEALYRYGIETLGLVRIVGLTTPGNRSSIRVLEKLGLRFEKTVRMGGDGDDGYAGSETSLDAQLD